MALRIPRSIPRSVYLQCNGYAHLRAPLSGSSRCQADDPATSLLNVIAPAKSSRPPQTSTTARLQTQPANLSNQVLSSSPSKSSSEALLSNMARFNTSRSAIARAPALQRSDDRKAETAHRQRVRQIEGQATRNWRDGDVYAPHDLSPVEMQKARQARLSARSNNMAPANTRKKGGKDVLDDLGIDPLKEYKNFAMMSEFMTEMGRIRHSRDTGLRPVNQRRMAKAVRRAIGIGIMPSVHRHPELTDERMALRRR